MFPLVISHLNFFNYSEPVMPLQNKSQSHTLMDRARRFIRHRVLAKDQVLDFDGGSITLPADHKLPDYLQACDQYDRFLPMLAGSLKENSRIIDVGANCGDSLAFMHAVNPSAHYIAVEPDAEFFKYLERNIAQIKHKHPNAKIITVQKMIGKSILSADLTGAGGTKSAVIGEGEFNTVSLDDVCKALNIESVDFIKTDVDGYDYDVIASATATIKKSEPLIFFECLLNNAAQRKAYDECIANLSAAGYRDWVVFDNLGHILLRTNQASEIKFFFDYTEKNRIPRKYMPFHYIDILAGFEHHSTIITTALALHDQASKAAIP